MVGNVARPDVRAPTWTSVIIASRLSDLVFPIGSPNLGPQPLHPQATGLTACQLYSRY